MKTKYERKFIRLTKLEADIHFKGWQDCPNISKTGSIIGMRKLYGWNGKVLAIGKYYYHYTN
ncbi:MAG: hypothetical protein WC389_22705 [Lutibacter sp.]|jgi:hypothetical protein